MPIESLDEIYEMFLKNIDVDEIQDDVFENIIGNEIQQDVFQNINSDAFYCVSNKLRDNVYVRTGLSEGIEILPNMVDST